MIYDPTLITMLKVSNTVLSLFEDHSGLTVGKILEHQSQDLLSQQLSFLSFVNSVLSQPLVGLGKVAVADRIH